MTEVRNQMSDVKNQISDSVFLFRIFFCFSVFCFLFSVISGCAPVKERVKEEEVSIPPSVENPGALKYVDNFDKGCSPNMIGGEIFVKSYADNSIQISYDKEEALRNKGYSLKIRYDEILANKNPEVVIDLNKLDISAAEGLCFWIKGKNGVEKFDIILTDWKNQRTDALNSSDLFNISKEWQKVKIPVEKFKNVDFNYMGELILRFNYPQDESSIYLDDVYFYGPPYVFFYSLKDNLRSFPEKKIVDSENLLELSDKKLLKRIARDTWRYFDEAVDKRHDMVCDYIDMNSDRIYRIGDFTSTTNLGLYFMCIVSAWDMGFINKEEAIERIDKTFEVIFKLPRWKNQWYNFYSTTNLQVTRPYVSSVDNGWLAAGVMVVRQTFPEEFNKIADKLLEEIDFSLLYDEVNGQLYLGYDADRKKLSDYHYGFIVTEPRVTSFIAIGKEDVPEYHWFRIYRVAPESWKWQTQMPKGIMKRYMGIDVFEGYYIYDDIIKVVPSWGGSLFEVLMPTIVIDEEKYVPESFGLNNVNTVKIHMDYMLNKRKYPVWGLSPCSVPNGGYEEFGVADIGIKGYKNFRVVTPHASILALPLMPEKVIDNIRTMLKLYDIYGEYGLYDSVNIDSGDVSYRYLCLDQGMILIQINNYFNDGIMQKRFHKDPIAKKAVETIKMEKFF